MQRFNYLQGPSAEYIEQLFEKYQNDPSSIDSSWQSFFDGIAWAKKEQEEQSSHVTSANGKSDSHFNISGEAKVAQMISAYRELGVLIADIDPLNAPEQTHPLLELSNFELTEADLEKEFTAARLIGIEKTTLSNIILRLKQVYCSTIGIECNYIQDPIMREWLQERVENFERRDALSVDEKKQLLKRLTDSETFEKFLHTRYVAQKRFSIEGGESLVPALDVIIENGADLGVQTVVMGMAHRGRLNVLHNIYGKKADQILTEFEDSYEAGQTSSSGDVKYHKGFSADIRTHNHHLVHLSLAHNPSHLEIVNPIVEGITRAKQRDLGDESRTKVLPILIHGDAAFAGQGIIYETLNLSLVEDYWVGGTVHIVLNNQVGFTTNPENSRSTRFATDIAKMLEIPIFHVNGDDPEAVWNIAKLCIEFRQKFKKDIIIDLICYRKYGHNEGDEPSFTQPLMYKKIKAHPSTRTLYANKLKSQGVISEEDEKKYIDSVIEKMTEAQKITREEKPKPIVSAYDGKWKGLVPASDADIFKVIQTNVKKEKILELSEKLNTFPNDFKIHPKLERFFEARKNAITSGEGIDWGNAETLAYATLLSENHAIRLTGQDVERGTFTHRHAVLSDHETGKSCVPLRHLNANQGDFIIRNSILSEAAVLGYEYGWSLADPDALVIWEAQFGDFVNGAQVIIDQFISSSESKWERASGITLLLPHGYEGQGPEHSSARLERFIQLCAENNMSVCNLTTPAQIFHALRRQVSRVFRKPMVIMSPKSLLRHPKAVSSLSDLTDQCFEEVLNDTTVKDYSKVKRVILCSGKIYYDLLSKKEEENRDDVALVRLEQIYPWPKEKLSQMLNLYPQSAEFYWVQEEPKNMGAWTYVFCQWCGGYNTFQSEVGNRAIRYIGRDMSAAPAVGSHKRHLKEQQKIIDESFTL